MSTDLPRRERFGEKRGLPLYRQLMGSTRSCTFQVVAIALGVSLLFAGPYLLQYLYYREYNPQGVGGFECRGVQTGFIPMEIDGHEYKLKTMQDRYRMTEGGLLVLAKGFRASSINTLLPAGAYNLAFRMNGQDKDGDFQVVLRNESGEVLEVFTQHLKRDRWYARGYDVQLEGGTYTLEVTPPSGLRWCLEVAHQGYDS